MTHSDSLILTFISGLFWLNNWLEYNRVWSFWDTLFLQLGIQKSYQTFVLLYIRIHKVSVLFLKNRIGFIVYIDRYKTKFWFIIYSLSYSWHLFKEMTTIMFLRKHCNHLSLKCKVGKLEVTIAKLAAISDWHEFFFIYKVRAHVILLLKRQTRICTTRPSHPFTCRLLFIVLFSIHKLVVSRNFYP